MADNQLPLLGAILCCTSIPPEQRGDIAATAAQMGAVHKLDLTSDVTHLIVGETDTPKYKFVAKERPDVKCVLPSWIGAVRVSWLEGGETNVEELEHIHKLPTFTGLKLCVTGFDDLDYRKHLEDAIMDNGGAYTGNLTKDVTHLVAKEPCGTKYVYAGQWGMKIVAVEWVEQSLERGMILEEHLYQLSIPPEQRGRDAWVRRSVSSTSLGKRPREDEVIPPNSRKLRRTASARLSSQNVGLWTELMGAPVAAEESREDSWEEWPKKNNEKMDAPVALKIPDSASVAPVERGEPSLKRSYSEASATSVSTGPLQRRGLFQEKTLLLRGFDEKQTSILEKHLRSHSAEIVNDASHLPFQNNFVVVPYTTSASDAEAFSEGCSNAKVVTDLWIERCLYLKRPEDPQHYVLSTPVPVFPLAGSKDLSICSTGYQGIELLHASKAVKLMGAVYSEYLDASSSVLVCKTVTAGHDKLRHAQVWGVPAVSDTWLWDSIAKGDIMPFESYLVQPITDPNISSKQTPILEQTNKATEPRKTDVKQKVAEPDIEKPTKTRPKAKGHVDTSANARSFTASSRSLGDGFDTEPLSRSFPKPSRTYKSRELPIYLDDDDTAPPVQSIPDNTNDSTHTLAPSMSAPLREITPNSSPPKPSPLQSKDLSFSKPKPQSPPSVSLQEQTPLSASKPKPQSPPISLSLQEQPPPSASEESSLGPAISSLLEHHKRSRAKPHPPPSESSDQPHQRRRRRQLFGRAPSNLSSHSYTNGIGVSRASSVDTMNTDGLGTPLELSNNTITNNNNNNNIHHNQTTKATPIPNPPNNNDFTLLYTTTPNQDDPDRIDPTPQMTQLGYEDPDVAAWRERVALKMAGGKVKSPPQERKGTTTPGKAKSVAQTQREESAREGLGIARRTRAAGGGR